MGNSELFRDITPGEEYEPDLMELTDGDGNVHNFEVIDVTTMENHRYFMLMPLEGDEDGDEAQYVIMRQFEDGDGEYLDVVKDAQEHRNAVEVFASRLEDLFDIDLE